MVAILVPGQFGPRLVGGIASAAATTWDPSHKTNCTLSNGNLTGTHSGGGNTALNMFSIAASSASQKVYFEIHVAQLTFGGNIGMSSDNTSSSLGDSWPTPSAGFVVVTNGHFRDQDSADDDTTVIGGWGTGDNIDIALDTANNRVWFRLNNGSWNASSGGGDPAANTGGMRVVSTGSSFYAFSGADAVDGDAFTATFSSSSWARTPPSGYTQLQ